MLAPTVAKTGTESSAEPAAGRPREQTDNSSARVRRSARYAQRATLWQASDLARVRKCGRARTSSDGWVAVRCRDGVAGFAGVQACGSVWACPVCASKILARRGIEIGAALGQAVSEGYALGFITLTMRHHRGQALSDLWAAAAKGWGRATSGRAWVKAQDVEGVVGWVRVWEVTHGRNGWHVHVHAVVVLEEGADGPTLDRVGRGMFDRWSKGLQAAGLAAPRRVGQDWHLVAGPDAALEVGRYVTKIAAPEGLGFELTHTLPGRSADGLKTRPTWALLDDLVTYGEARSLRLWGEWERASHGRRQMGWSVGLRAKLLAGVEEATDEEIVGEEFGSDDDALVVIAPEGWGALVATPHRLPVVLDTAEVSGLAGLRALLDGWGDVPYIVPAARGGGPATEEPAPPPLALDPP